MDLSSLPRALLEGLQMEIEVSFQESIAQIDAILEMM